MANSWFPPLQSHPLKKKKKKPGFLSSSLNESQAKVVLLIREASGGLCSTATELY